MTKPKLTNTSDEDELKILKGEFQQNRRKNEQ